MNSRRILRKVQDQADDRQAEADPEDRLPVFLERLAEAIGHASSL
jgi:hypothetical protein